MNQEMFSRSIMLLGEEAFGRLQQSHVVIFGIGGVGGTAAESLLRSGVGELTLVDFDKVDISNLNRQILFANQDVGSLKVEAGKKHLLSINPEAKITIINEKIDAGFFQKHELKADYFLDAVDDLYAKMEIARYCIENDYPLLVSLGMANRIHPSGFKKVQLNQTENDPLARKLRHLLKDNGIDLKKVSCVQTIDGPDIISQIPASLMMTPSSAGLFMGACALKYLAKK